jgi:hypothetical protein
MAILRAMAMTARFSAELPPRAAMRAPASRGWLGGPNGPGCLLIVFGGARGDRPQLARVGHVYGMAERLQQSWHRGAVRAGLHRKRVWNGAHLLFCPTVKDELREELARLLALQEA